MWFCGRPWFLPGSLYYARVFKQGLTTEARRVEEPIAFVSRKGQACFVGVLFTFYQMIVSYLRLGALTYEFQAARAIHQDNGAR